MKKLVMIACMWDAVGFGSFEMVFGRSEIALRALWP